MVLSGLRRLRNYGRLAASYASGNALIVLYHRVLETSFDPQLLSVHPRNFAEHMEVLGKACRPIALRELAAGINAGKLRPRSVLVTFDDGYADNFHQARPILERLGVPATVFVTSGYVGDQGEYWWDELERVLLMPGTLPRHLRLHVGEFKLEWDLGDSCVYTDADRSMHERWTVRNKSIPTPRHALYLALHKKVRPLPFELRNDVLDGLRAWAGVGYKGRPANLPMSADEVRELARSGLIEVGAHTVTHPVLSSTEPRRQFKEISESKASLEQILGRPVTSFAYPFGSATDYDGDSVAAARKAGFTCACSNYPGLIRRKNDPHQLPRVLAGDWNGDEFARRLRNWFTGA